MCRVAHRAGVTYATTSLSKETLFGGASAFIGGLAVTFRTGSAHALEANAIIKSVTALHIRIGRAAPYRGTLPGISVGTQVATLRRLLFDGVSEDEETGYWFEKAADVRILSDCHTSRSFNCNFVYRVPYH